MLSRQESQLRKLVLDGIGSQNPRLMGRCVLGGPPSQTGCRHSNQQQQCPCHGSCLGWEAPAPLQPPTLLGVLSSCCAAVVAPEIPPWHSRTLRAGFGHLHFYLKIGAEQQSEKNLSKAVNKNLIKLRVGSPYRHRQGEAAS